MDHHIVPRRCRRPRHRSRNTPRSVEDSHACSEYIVGRSQADIDCAWPVASGSRMLGASDVCMKAGEPPAVTSRLHRVANKPNSSASNRLTPLCDNQRPAVHCFGRLASGCAARQRHSQQEPPMPRTAIVTGSTSGIGEGIARALAASGCNVVINGFGDAAAIEKIRASIEADSKVKCVYSPRRHDQARADRGDVRHRARRPSARSTSSSTMPACSTSRRSRISRSTSGTSSSTSISTPPSTPRASPSPT